jgi:hypothetical protein
MPLLLQANMPRVATPTHPPPTHPHKQTKTRGKENKQKGFTTQPSPMHLAGASINQKVNLKDFLPFSKPNA